MTEELKKKFHTDMLKIYDDTVQDSGGKYRPTEFRRMVLERSGYDAALMLLGRPETSGLARLFELGLEEISMEALVLNDKYASLFSEEQKAIARKHLGR